MNLVFDIEGVIEIEYNIGEKIVQDIFVCYINSDIVDIVKGQQIGQIYVKMFVIQ